MFPNKTMAVLFCCVLGIGGLKGMSEDHRVTVYVPIGNLNYSVQCSLHNDDILKIDGSGFFDNNGFTESQEKLILDRVGGMIAGFSNNKISFIPLENIIIAGASDTPSYKDVIKSGKFNDVIINTTNSKNVKEDSYENKWLDTEGSGDITITLEGAKFEHKKWVKINRPSDNSIVTIETNNNDLKYEKSLIHFLVQLAGPRVKSSDMQKLKAGIGTTRYPSLMPLRVIKNKK
jgi:hypothetical protein